MKVLAINGSARRGGNTAVLLETAFASLRKADIETELVQLAGQWVRPCRACWACGGRENCVHGGDPFRELFETMKAADGLLLGSPSYAANLSANMQALLERAAVVADMNPGLFSRKVGASVSAARRAGALSAADGMNRFFLNHDMFVAGSTYWAVGYGRLPGEVKDDEEALATAARLGENMAYYLRLQEAAR